MRLTLVRLSIIPLVLTLGCGNSVPTAPPPPPPPVDLSAPTLREVQAHRQIWSAHHLKNYSYRYLTTGFFIAWEGRELALMVRNNQVTSAAYIGTGEQLSDPGDLPTIDQLFDWAEGAARDHSLKAIGFDPVLGYPARMDLAGPPDASGSVFAVKVQAGS